MSLTSLRISGLRCLQAVDVVPTAAGAVLTGANGAGKTSVLEAVHLLGHGRSFRGRVADGLVGRTASAVEVFAQLCSDGPQRLGLRHAGDSWEGRVDGRSLGALSELVTCLPVLAFDPTASALLTGPAEERRRFLDFLLFHVEPEFLGWWRRYGRALKQRNGLLRTAGRREEFDAFEAEMATAALPLHRMRDNAVAQLENQLRQVLPELSPGFPPVALSLRPGWRAEEAPLRDLLYLHRDRDKELGYTTQGPHRADLRIEVSGLTVAQLSRGQGKVLALALVLSQAAALLAATERRPVLCLDDLFAELDEEHARRALALVTRFRAQTWITSPVLPVAVRPLMQDFALFHVEHGAISRM